MATIVNVSDFVGRYLLAKTTYNVDDIQAYIDEFEPLAIAQLLGAELGAAFIANLNSSGVPVLTEFLAIFNPLSFDGDGCGCDNELHVSQGMKHYITGIIYWWYVVESRVAPLASGGSGQSKGEVTDSGRMPAAETYQRYNASIATGKAIQAYIRKNSDDYPTFKGTRLLYNYR
jgi:hypothetical protein